MHDRKIAKNCINLDNSWVDKDFRFIKFNIVGTLVKRVEVGRVNTR